ncbi:MAG: hypothetical protein CO114_03255 [Euryarchaeota archaeon CG_4_9_14_3_um_filter_38_12]|nr:MAG: hypothetical protein CO114_03255 [Euryarchaeota archaeon CG_4_9_14_3_um_filter_38_12]
MQISGCGYACSECVLKENGICSSCSMENEIADVCEIMTCLKDKNLEICLKCPDRYKNGKICETYSNGLRHCPLRIGVLTR